MHDPALQSWLREAHATSQWTTSVCTGDVAQVIQLAIEYDPDPPFDAGSPATAPASAVDFLRATWQAWATDRLTTESTGN